MERFAQKRKRFPCATDRCGAEALKQAEAGMPVAELIRQQGITEQTLLEEAVTKVQGTRNRPGSPVQTAPGRERLVAELALDKVMPQGMLAKTL